MAPHARPPTSNASAPTLRRLSACSRARRPMGQGCCPTLVDSFCTPVTRIPGCAPRFDTSGIIGPSCPARSSSICSFKAPRMRGKRPVGLSWLTRSAGLEIGLGEVDERQASALVTASIGEVPLIAHLSLGTAVSVYVAAVEAGAQAVSIGAPRGALPGPDGAPICGRLYGPAVFPLLLQDGCSTQGAAESADHRRGRSLSARAGRRPAARRSGCGSARWGPVDNAGKSVHS